MFYELGKKIELSLSVIYQELMVWIKLDAFLSKDSSHCEHSNQAKQEWVGKKVQSFSKLKNSKFYSGFPNLTELVSQKESF